MDIWPLYLFHERAQTINAAISLRAHCTLVPRADRRIVIRSDDTGAQVQVSHWSDLRATHDLKLVGRILHHFEADGVEVRTRSGSPVGAGIAGSSAMNIAVCGAVARWRALDLTDAQLLEIALNVEAQTIDVPTGAQDYRPAFYGGVSAVELRVNGVRRVPLRVDTVELQRRLVLAYTGASRHSGINNWEITKRHIDGDREIHATFERIRDVTVALREALERHDWDAVAREVDAEWEARKRLAPGVTTPVIEALMMRARRAGARAAKVCGAGGGGCLFCVCDPEHVPGVRAALEEAGARVLDFQIETRGLLVETSVAV